MLFCPHPSIAKNLIGLSITNPPPYIPYIILYAVEWGGILPIEYYKNIFQKNKKTFQKVYKNACNMFLYVL
jgi:hypothetical protein